MNFYIAFFPQEMKYVLHVMVNLFPASKKGRDVLVNKGYWI